MPEELNSTCMTHPGPIRSNYQQGLLERKDLSPDPMEMFRRWWAEAIAADIYEVNAMTLATVSPEGQPSARTVLLKGILDEGFEFYTNYKSHKAREMEMNPQVALLFFWKELEKQIRIEGIVEKVSEERSKQYFQSRPRSSQIGAWASPQSQVIQNRQEIINEVIRLEKQFEGEDPLPLPEHWGGYLVRPHAYEFWQGRENRLHDRFVYTKEKAGWSINRLAP